MIFLDTDKHYLVADTRAEMVTTLLEQLPANPDDDTLAELAAACLDCEVLEVMIVSE